MAVDRSERLYRMYSDRYMIGVLLQGRVDWQHRNRALEQQPGDCVTTAPGDVYVSRCHHAPGSWRVLFIDPQVIDRTAERLGFARRLAPSRAQSGDPRLRSSLLASLEAIQQPHSSLSADEALEKLLTHWIEHTGAKPSDSAGVDSRALSRALEYLDANWLHDVRLDDAAT